MAEIRGLLVINHAAGAIADNKETQNERYPPDKSIELSIRLFKKLLKLTANFRCIDGSRTDYQKLRESPEFEDFERDAQLLHFVDLTKLGNDSASFTEEVSKAFFINIYNILTIHTLAKLVTNEKTMLELKDFWQRYAYRIGAAVFSLDDIEHGILRCNKLHPTKGTYFFGDDDPRRHLVLPQLDSRIHFVLNCGAKSCPPIRLLTAQNLEKALDLAARGFCKVNVILNVNEKCLILSKIFDWYGKDFANNEIEKVTQIAEYLSEDQRQQIRDLAEDLTIQYAEYTWDIQ